MVQKILFKRSVFSWNALKYFLNCISIRERILMFDNRLSYLFFEEKVKKHAYVIIDPSFVGPSHSYVCSRPSNSRL